MISGRLWSQEQDNTKNNTRLPILDGKNLSRLTVKQSWISDVSPPSPTPFVTSLPGDSITDVWTYLESSYGYLTTQSGSSVAVKGEIGGGE
ncbi:hypothetical protein L2E82_10730 [Cichorium intybus]|uniref:Uncharacterized protein n=1 Tax=Cichorium intybus TaxID=13427 RepID=A0ACB9GB99_CICIN|nr:hypothetical protein L2E82_10730 [Cichorium intybus]